jgi:hypothetical protein
MWAAGVRHHPSVTVAAHAFMLCTLADDAAAKWPEEEPSK